MVRELDLCGRTVGATAWLDAGSPAPDPTPRPPNQDAADAPAGPHAAWGDIDWQEVPARRHSLKGQIGVDYVLFADLTLVVKRGPGVGREWLATQLAMDVGCRVPTPMTLGPPPDAAMCGLLELAPEIPVLMMGFVPGRTFFELSQDDQEAFCQPDGPRGRRLIGQMGLALAFDLFSGNIDRFPAVGPLGANSGNLMVCGDDIVCIDNAIWHHLGEPGGREAKQRRWSTKVAAALGIADGADGPDAAKSLAFLEKTASFVTARLRDAALPRAEFQASWAEAFCGGILAVSALSHEGLDAQVARLQPPPRGWRQTSRFCTKIWRSFTGPPPACASARPPPRTGDMGRAGRRPGAR